MYTVYWTDIDKLGREFFMRRFPSRIAAEAFRHEVLLKQDVRDVRVVEG